MENKDKRTQNAEVTQGMSFAQAVCKPLGQKEILDELSSDCEQLMYDLKQLGAAAYMISQAMYKQSDPFNWESEALHHIVWSLDEMATRMDGLLGLCWSAKRTQPAA